MYATIEHHRNVLDVNGRASEEVNFFAQARVYLNFGVLEAGSGASETCHNNPYLDLFRSRDIGVFYQDECLRFEVVHEREQGDPRLGPSSSLRVRLTLATLGDTAEQGQYER